MFERQLQFIQRIVARFVDTRGLAGGPDEQAREQIRQRRMVVPVRNQAAQQIGTAQERRVVRCRGPEHEVIAAAGTGMAAVEHELLAAQARLAGSFIQVSSAIDEFVPTGRGVNVDFDHARVRSDSEHAEPGILRRLVPFQHDRLRLAVRYRLDGSDDFKIVLESLSWRHEDIKHAVARLSAHGCANDRVR